MKVKEHVYMLTIREKDDDAKEDSDIYLRNTLLSKVLRYFVESDLEVKIKYMESMKVENPEQMEIALGLGDLDSE